MGWRRDRTAIGASERSTVKAIYKRHGPLALIGPRKKLMQHWADRVDNWLDPKKVVPMKPGLAISSCPLTDHPKLAPPL